MPDREWFKATGSSEDFPNLESASDYAQNYTATTGNEAMITRCTETAVRRYTRQVTVVPEDIPSLD